MTRGVKAGSCGHKEPEVRVEEKVEERLECSWMPIFKVKGRRKKAVTEDMASGGI